MPRRPRAPRSKVAAARKSRVRAGRSKSNAPRSSAAGGFELANIRAVKFGTADAPQPVGSNSPNTVVYVHGIGNKPLASVLKCQWDMALFGVRLGDRSCMAYWVNREYYPVPLDDTCEKGDTINTKALPFSLRAAAVGGSTHSTELVDDEIKAITSDAKRRAVLRRIAAKMMTPPRPPTAEIGTRDLRAKVIPLPAPVRDLIAGQLTAMFLHDVHDFLYVKERREAMEHILLDRIRAGGGPFVIVAHSQGTMIAYDLLRQLNKSQCDVSLFITIGSPLGLDEVQDELRRWCGVRGKLPFPPCVDSWLNVADRLDPVALDNDISDDSPGRSITSPVGVTIKILLGARIPQPAISKMTSCALQPAPDSAQPSVKQSPPLRSRAISSIVSRTGIEMNAIRPSFNSLADRMNLQARLTLQLHF